MLNSSSSTTKGFVWLVGAGPGAADLITLRGLRLLQSAEAVVHDELSNHELLAHCPPGCEIHAVGKRAGHHSATQAEINALLVQLGNEGRKIVRLKGGDPMIFGRAGEEIDRLDAAGIEVAALSARERCTCCPSRRRSRGRCARCRRAVVGGSGWRAAGDFSHGR